MEKNRILLILVITVVAALFILGRDGVFGLLNINKPAKIVVEPEDIKIEKTQKKIVEDIPKEPEDKSNDELPEIDQPKKVGGGSSDSGSESTFIPPLSVTIKVPVKVGEASVSAGSTSKINLEE